MLYYSPKYICCVKSRTVPSIFVELVLTFLDCHTCSSGDDGNYFIIFDTKFSLAGFKYWNVTAVFGVFGSPLTGVKICRGDAQVPVSKEEINVKTIIIQIPKTPETRSVSIGQKMTSLILITIHLLYQMG